MYFNNFPTTLYPKKDGQLETVQDILVRIAFEQSTKEQIETFLIYNVPEGYTPEKIAEDVYGNQKYFWVVLLINEFFDPSYSVSLRSRSLDDYIDRKYRSKTLFLTSETDSEQFYTHPIGGNSTVSTFREGDTITVYLGSRLKYKDMGNDKVLGVVKRYIPELCALQLDSLTGVIREGDIIVRGYDTEIRAKVSKVIDSRFAVHHFEENERRLNPFATPPDDFGNQVPLGQTGDGFSDPVGTTQTILENYINEDVTIYNITNEEYEFKKNEESRSIKLLSPQLLENVLREFREVIAAQ